MKKIKLLKDWNGKKIGDIINISKKGAEQFIAEGAGEILDVDKEKPIKPWSEFTEEEKEARRFTAKNHNWGNNKIGVLDEETGIINLKERDKKEELTKAEKKEIAKRLRDEEKKQKQENVSFDYELYNPSTEIKNLEQLEKVIKKNFPSIWFETKACLSICSTLALKNLNGCPSLNLIGNPSGEKTTILSFFYGQENTYLSDDFTPRAFVTQSAGVGGDMLESVDLLPKLKNKILISPELAPMFEAPRDKLIENFSMLTRVLDGEGLNRDSGTHGHRGYSGDYKFAWLGASTPIRASVWNIMGKIGNRLFFLNMKDKNRNNSDYLEMFRGRAYEEKIKECRGAVRSFLNNFYKNKKIRSIEWDAEGDIFILQEIIKYAKFLSKLRGSLMLWKSEEQGKYEFNFPVIEEPPRAINSLYNLAKGHALIHGRTFLRTEDLEVVKAVCFSSMPHDRSEFLKLLAKHEGKLTTQTIQKELNCSDETARKTMNIFKILGVVDLKNIPIGNEGRPMLYIEIKDEFAELLKETRVLNGLEKGNPSESKGESVDYSDINPADFIKNEVKNAHTHPQIKLEKGNPSKINPVCDEEIDLPDFSDLTKDLEDTPK